MITDIFEEFYGLDVLDRFGTAYIVGVADIVDVFDIFDTFDISNRLTCKWHICVVLTFLN